MDKNELEKLLIEGKTNREIAVILNKSKSTISYNVKKLNLTHLYKYKKPEYNNENYFKVIDTKEKAYILGFLLGDGYFPKDRIKRNLGLTISKKDECIIKFMKKELNMNIINQERKVGFPMVEFTIGNPSIVNDVYCLLNGYNKTERKVPNIDAKLERYFILGFFDAEGSACYGKRKNNKIYRVITMTSTHNIQTGIQEMLYRNGIELHLTKDKIKKCSYLKVGNKENIKSFINFIYPNNDFVVLNRKYLKCMELLNTYN